MNVLSVPLFLVLASQAVPVVTIAAAAESARPPRDVAGSESGNDKQERNTTSTPEDDEGAAATQPDAGVAVTGKALPDKVAAALDDRSKNQTTPL